MLKLIVIKHIVLGFAFNEWQSILFEESHGITNELTPKESSISIA